MIFLLVFLLQISPVSNLRAFDTPNDKGGVITIEWELSQDYSILSCYEIFRSTGEEYYSIGTALPGTGKFVDAEAVARTNYWYKIRAVSDSGEADSEPVGPVMSSAQWFHRGRLNMLVAAIVLSTLIIWFISRAKRGVALYIRKIAGLDAVDDAVGRATELGKSVLFIPGILDMDDIQTITAMTILRRVAGRTAQYDTSLVVPVTRSLVMTVARETVKEAHYDVGRPDSYNQENIWYLTDDQFGYAAGVDGIMLRDKPGAIFLMGAFYAESLILAETGHSIGAIQIAGTAMPSQLPFFVAACDYTLIGEELFAASAYLSKDSALLGSLKGQDWGKAIFIGLIVLGVILASFGITWLARLLTVV